jgi:hypothetical protein
VKERARTPEAEAGEEQFDLDDELDDRTMLDSVILPIISSVR